MNSTSTESTVKTTLLNLTTNALLETVNTTISSNLSTTSRTQNGENRKYLSQKNYFMLMIGGWILTAIFIFGVLFMVVTHFLGRYQWRKYQEKREQDKKKENYVFVDPKILKYSKRGWQKILYDMS